MGSLLQESLIKFNKKQEKWLSTPKSIINTTTATRDVPANTSTKLPFRAVRFSDDLERWQQINNARLRSVGAQIKCVIDLLLKERQSLTADEIKEKCHVDVKGNKVVFESLAKNPKASYDGNRFSYKPKHNLKDKKELLGLIQKFPDGIAVVDFEDAYPTVIQDFEALKAVGDIRVVPKFISQGVIVFPHDPRVPLIKADDELKQLFSEIELPRDMLEIEKYLKENGMKPATDTAKRRLMAQKDNSKIYKKPEQKKRKKTGINKRTKLTNAHLPELFRILNM